MNTSARSLEPCAPRALAGAFYSTLDNALRLTSFNAAVGVVLTIAGQMLTPEGDVRDFAFTHTPNTDRTIATTNFRVGDGHLLNAHVFASSGTPRRGQCFARLQLLQGFTGAAIAIGTLVQGYVQDTSALAWPGSPIQASSDGAGVVRAILGTDPAAGVEISETVPTNARWRLIAIAYTLVASAAAANRLPVLTIDDGTNILWETFSNIAVTASQTAKYRAGAGVPFHTFDTRAYHLPLPETLLLMGGSRVRTVTAAIDAGDDYGAPALVVEEWIED